MRRLGIGLLLAIGLLSALWFLIGDRMAEVQGAVPPVAGVAAPGEDANAELTPLDQVLSTEELAAEYERQAVDAAEGNVEQEDMSLQMTAVHGRVLDEHGRPVAGVQVALLKKLKPPTYDVRDLEDLAVEQILADRLSRGEAVTISGGNDSEVDRSSGRRVTNFQISLGSNASLKLTTLITDANGAFDFGERRAIPMVLCYGSLLLMGPSLSHDVVAGGEAHVLYLPPRCFTGVDLTLSAPEGEQAPNPQSAEFTLLSYAGDAERAYRDVRTQDVTLSPGRVIAQGLAPGTWKVSITCEGEGTLFGRVTVEPGPELTCAGSQLEFRSRETMAAELESAREIQRSWKGR
ncbi:MAG: hypothetical protein ACI8QS_002420 [Planctomycetota bacterium]|jgi:hypothetical protein